MRGVTLILDKPTQHLGLTEVTLYSGEIEEGARELFSWGLCHVLAGALHEITGWRFGIFEQFWDEKWAWAHAGVMVPGTGLFLDIQGAREAAQVEQDWASFSTPFRLITVGSLPEFALRLAVEPHASWRNGLNADVVDVVLSIAQRLVETAAPRGEVPQC